MHPRAETGAAGKVLDSMGMDLNSLVLNFTQNISRPNPVEAKG